MLELVDIPGTGGLPDLHIGVRTACAGVPTIHGDVTAGYWLCMGFQSLQTPLCPQVPNLHISVIGATNKKIASILLLIG